MSATAIQPIQPLAAKPTIPAGWEAKAAMVDQCVFAGKRLSLWISMLIAESREDFGDPSDWISACTDRWGWDKAHLHHIHAVGRLLLSPMPGVVHAPLCELEFEKVLAISRLPAKLIGPFLAKARPQDHSRDEVRAAVTRWRAAAGEPADEAPQARRQIAGPPVQVDFLDALFAAATDDARCRAMAADPQPAHKTAMGGLVLINVAILKYGKQDSPEKIADLEEILDEMEKQEATLREMLRSTFKGIVCPPGLPETADPDAGTGEEF